MRALDVCVRRGRPSCTEADKDGDGEAGLGRADCGRWVELDGGGQTKQRRATTLVREGTCLECANCKRNNHQRSSRLISTAMPCHPNTITPPRHCPSPACTDSPALSSAAPPTLSPPASPPATAPRTLARACPLAAQAQAQPHQPAPRLRLQQSTLASAHTSPDAPRAGGRPRVLPFRENLEISECPPSRPPACSLDPPLTCRVWLSPSSQSFRPFVWAKLQARRQIAERRTAAEQAHAARKARDDSVLGT